MSLVGFKRATRAAALAVLFCASVCASAAASPRAVEEAHLDNGLTLLVEAVPASPAVTLEAWIQAGARLEGEYQGTGISHFLEHMLFKGTRRRPVGRIEEEIKSWGGEANAFTSQDYTVFKITVPPDHWKDALDVLKDALFHSSFDAREIEKERRVILREIALNEDDADRRLYKNFWEHAFRTHPYREPVLGHAELLNKLTRQDLVAYHGRFYVPNNMAIVVAGNVATAEAVQAIRGLFSDVPRRPVVLLEPRGEPEGVSARSRVEPFTVRPARAILGFPGVSVHSPDLFALDVAAEILGGGESSRLSRSLKREAGLAYDAEATNVTPYDPGLFLIELTLETGRLKEAEKRTLEILRKLIDEGPTPAELERAKARVATGYLRHLQTTEGRAYDLGSSFLLTGDALFSERYVEAVRGVDAPQVQAVLKTIARPESLLVFALVPKGEEAAAGMEGPAPEAPVLDTSEETLPNGMRVIVRTDPTAPLVSVRATLLGGVRADPPGLEGLAYLTLESLELGTRAMDREKIAETVDRFGGAFQTESGNNSCAFGIDLLPENFENGTRLLADLFQSPTFPNRELEQKKSEITAAIRQEEADVFDRTTDLFRKTLFQTHAYRNRAQGTGESLARIKRGDVDAFHRRFFRPDNLVVAVSGPVTKASVLPLLERLFSNGGEAPFSFPEVTPEAWSGPARTAEDRMEKEQALVVIGFPGLRVTDPDRYALEVLASSLSGGSGRLYQKIRNRQGSSYVLGAVNVLGIDPAYLMVYVSTRPELVPEVEREIWRILASLQEKPLDPGELEACRHDLLARHREEMERPQGWARAVSLDELYGLGVRHAQEYEARIQAVTAQDVQQAARKILDQNRSATVRILPSSVPSGASGS